MVMGGSFLDTPDIDIYFIGMYRVLFVQEERIIKISDSKKGMK